MAYDKNYSNNDRGYNRGDRNYERNNDRNNESFYSKRIKAGKRRTYFFDVRATRGSDYFITITESKKRFDDNGYDRHKMFLYKEDFNKFLQALTDTVNFVKTDLMPDFDFDAFNHDNDEDGQGAEQGNGQRTYQAPASVEVPADETTAMHNESSSVSSNNDTTGIDDWKM